MYPAEHGLQRELLGNAAIGNFFGLRKSELLHLQEFKSIDHSKAELIEYLDYYNKQIKAEAGIWIFYFRIIQS